MSGFDRPGRTQDASYAPSNSAAAPQREPERTPADIANERIAGMQRDVAELRTAIHAVRGAHDSNDLGRWREAQDQLDRARTRAREALARAQSSAEDGHGAGTEALADTERQLAELEASAQGLGAPPRGWSELSNEAQLRAIATAPIEKRNAAAGWQTKEAALMGEINELSADEAATLLGRLRKRSQDDAIAAALAPGVRMDQSRYERITRALERRKVAARASAMQQTARPAAAGPASPAPALKDAIEGPVAPQPKDVLRLTPQDTTAQLKHAAATGADAPTSPASSRATLTYLMINSAPAWRSIGEHLGAVSWPSSDEVQFEDHAFVAHLLPALKQELVDFSPAKIDLALAPHDLYAEIEPMRPSDAIVWSPALGARLGQLFHLVAGQSLARMLPRFARAVEARAKEAEHAELVIEPGELITSHAMDRYIARALTARVDQGAKLQVAFVAPHAPHGVTKETLREVKLRWEGSHDPRRWNWVRAIEPADASPEEVGATLFASSRTRFAGDTTSFMASQLANAAPLFGLPGDVARQFPDALAYAPIPMPARPGEPADTPEARLAGIATTHAADDVALHQAAMSTDAAPVARSREDALGAFDDASVQLVHLRGALGPWGFAGELTGAMGYVSNKRAELAKSGKDALEKWGPIAIGERDRLFRIVAAVQQVTTSAGKLGARRDSSHPLHPILAKYAAAATSAHMAATCDALIADAEAAQASLSLQSLQANMVDLESALDEAHPGARAGDKTTGEQGSIADRVRDEANVLQSKMVAGHTVDPHELERVQLDAQEAALRLRVHGLRVQIGVLQVQAGNASHGFSNRIAGLFSGKFRDLPGVAGYLVAALEGVQLEMDAIHTRESWKPRSGDADGLDPSSPEVTAKRIAVTNAQTRFAKLSEDNDLRHFLSEGAQLVENQQLRSACVQAAVMLGITLATSAIGGWVAESLGSRFMSAQAVETVAELSKGAQRFISGATFTTEVLGNGLGQYATTDDGLLKSLAENALIMFGVNKTLGVISRDVEEGRAFHRALDRQVKAIETLEAETAMKSSRLAKIATWTAAQSIEITGHAVTGMAMGGILQKLEEQLGVKEQEHGQRSTSGEMRELMIQSASIALAKLTHARLGERMPSLARLAQQNESARGAKLYADAQALLALSQAVASAKHADAMQALEVLDRQQQLLLDEIATIDELILKHGGSHPELGDLAAGRAQLEHQLSNVNDTGMLSVRFQLVGLHDLGGSLWSGTPAQLARAKEQILHSDPNAKVSESNGVLTAEVRGQRYEIHERIDRAADASQRPDSKQAPTSDKVPSSDERPTGDPSTTVTSAQAADKKASSTPSTLAERLAPKGASHADIAIVERVLAADETEGSRLVREYGEDLIDYLRFNPFQNLAALEVALRRERGQIKDRVTGFYEGVDVSRPPAGWTFRDRFETDAYGTKIIKTDVVGPNGEKGYFERGYDPGTKQIELRMAFLRMSGQEKALPSTVEKQGSAKEMIEGKGSPTVQYITAYQLKKLGITVGDTAHVERMHLSDIQNIETIVHLHWLRQNVGADVDELIVHTASVKYAETTAVQTGFSRASDALVQGGQESPIGELMDFQEQNSASRKAENDAILRKYGYDRSTQMLWGFDIDFALGAQ